MARALRDAGHEVVLLREVIAPDSADPIVAATAEAGNAILVSLDKDFKRLAARTSVGIRQFRKLSRVALTCNAPQAAARTMGAMSLIEHEWTIAQASRDSRMIIEIGNTMIRILR